MDELFDVCIVGSGAGGAVSAYEIANKGFRVLLLEKGKRKIDFMKSNNPLDFVTHNMYRNSMTPILGNGIITTVLAETWGGTTEINSAILKNAPEEVLNSWFNDHLKVNPEYVMNFYKAYDEIENELNLNSKKSSPLGINNEILKFGLEKLNWESSLLPRAVEKCEASGNCLTFCPGGKKLSMSKTYLKWAEKNNLVAVDEVEVKRIKKTSEHISIFSIKDGKKQIYKAKKVILSAGIFESPKILLKSGFKNKEIGKNLTMHLGVAVLGKHTTSVENWNAQTQGWSSSEFIREGMVIESLSMLPGLVATRLPGVGLEFKKRLEEIDKISVATIKVSSKNKGRIFVFGNRVFPFFNLSKKDLNDALFGIEKCSEVLFSAGARCVYTGIKSFHEELESTEQLSELRKLKLRPADITFMSNHIFGTCSLGKVTDEYGELLDHKDVYVADTSIIPTTMANNPQKTIMAFSKIISKKICEDLSGK